MKSRDHGVLALFIVACFASAFLIFLVQPMVGKRILPWFGGVPAVWALCLAFFQTTLFAGYAYAHLLNRYAAAGAQLAVHAALCVAAVVLLPVLPESAWKPLGGDEPGSAILAMLVANVALPFVALAATGPLIQAWFARIRPDRSPYPLYAVSNLGSLAALLGYPFVIEPALTLSATGRAWSVAFAVSAAAVVACAALAWRSAPGRAATVVLPQGAPPAWGVRALWILLPGCAVVLLMGVTNDLCTDSASVPFLWILPLATYLVTFILCFASERFYHRTFFLALAAAAFLAPLVSDDAGKLWGFVHGNLALGIARYLLLLFGACMVLHGELYRLRPEPARLTAFYLSVSFGGAVGGVLVGVAAPYLLEDYYELPLGLAAAWLLLVAADAIDPNGWLRGGRAGPPDGGLRGRRVRQALAAVATLAVLGFGVRAMPPEPHVIYQERTFFGVLRVVGLDKGPNAHLKLRNGTTLHGVQFPSRPKLPTSYYHRHSGIGFAIAAHPRDEPIHVGVVGLGVGTLAAYGRPGDRYRFYEIDPAVTRIAQTSGYFSYLYNSAARIEIVEGDARISLESERANGHPRFDLLAIDAYSSDALPVHLLTREAVTLFLDSVEPSGLVAFHVSSRNFDLAPLLDRISRAVGARLLMISSPHTPRVGATRARWAFVSRDPERLAALVRFARRRVEAIGAEPDRYQIWSPGPGAFPNAPLWTDDYSDLLGVLKR